MHMSGVFTTDQGKTRLIEWYSFQSDYALTVVFIKRGVYLTDLETVSGVVFKQIIRLFDMHLSGVECTVWEVSGR